MNRDMVMAEQNMNCRLVLQKIYDLDRAEKTLALDYIFEWFDDQFRDSNFSECNTLIGTVDISRLSSTALIGILSITLNAKENLDARSGLLEKIKARFQFERPNDVERLLRGL